MSDTLGDRIKRASDALALIGAAAATLQGDETPANPDAPAIGTADLARSIAAAASAAYDELYWVSVVDSAVLTMDADANRLSSVSRERVR